MNKLDTTWNWSFNMPCKSFKGILVLFEEEKPYERDTSKFDNPKIQKVCVIVEGKPNQLYAQGMRSFEQYHEICRYFAEEKQKDNNTNEVQKYLQLHDLSAGEYLTDKYALWLDFRTIDENTLHWMGRRIENASEGIILQIKKKAESAGNLNAYIYLIKDVNKKAVINPKNENDEECFKWTITTALYYKEIKSNPKCMSKIIGYANNCNWSRLQFPVAINKINEFEKNSNDIAVNVLGIKGQKIYICRKSKYYNQKNVVNLLLIDDGKKRHYTVIKSSSRLLGSSNSKHKSKQHFCLNCLQGFTLKKEEIITLNTVKSMKQ